MSDSQINVRLTGYWPFQSGLSYAERRMEGGTHDRLSRPLYTLEMHLSDPSSYPYVSVSGDDAIWPYGQRIMIPNWPDAIFRIVDTGSHFRGFTKVIRVVGYEPLDICVDTSKTKLPRLTTAIIKDGDSFSSRQVAYDKLPTTNPVILAVGAVGLSAFDLVGELGPNGIAIGAAIVAGALILSSGKKATG